MVNSNRWSWSGAPRKSRVPEDAVISSEPLISPSLNPDPVENSVPADKKLLQPGAAGVSSRRRTNRWSWRPDATISVTAEDQQENEPEVGQLSPSEAEAARPVTSSGPRRRLSKLSKKPDATSTKRPRPLSLIAPASASFGAAPSFSHLQQQQQEQQREAGDQSSSQPSPLPAEPSIGVKVLNRFLSRRFSKRQPKSPRAQEAEPMPPMPSHQQEQTSPAKPMQSPMRGGPQLHNPQNTLRGASPANPATPVQGRIDNGRMGAPLPGLDEQSELQLPAPDIPPVSTADATTSLGPGTTSSSTPAPSADETGILGRLRRRRMASKDKDTDNNKKRWMSTGGDRTKGQPVGADDHTNTNSSDPVRNIDETNDAEMQAQSLLPPASHASQKKLNDKTKTEDGQPVSDTRNQSSSSVPRFLRQVVRPQQATSPTQAAGAVTPHESKPRSQSHSQTQSKQHMAAATPSAQPKVRTKPSFGKRFWSKSGANDFGDDDTKTDAPAAAPVVRPIYVPKHAAADFSRTTHPARHQRQSISIATGDDSIRPLATISTQAIEDELQFREQRMRTLSAEKEAEKRKSRDISSSKYGAPSRQELYRRLEIVKSSEIEVVTTREPGVLDAWAQLHGESIISSANGKGLARSHSQSRPRSSQRHSFNLVADPYARDLTPPKSVSPVEMEAPFDPPSQSSRQTPEQSPQPASQQTPEKPKAYKPTHAAHSSRPRYQPEEKPRKDMSDFERFIADAEDADRDYHAQMWRNLARRSGHYGYADNTFGSFRPDPVSLNPGVMMNTQQSSKRDSAYYSTNKRASVLSAPGEDELKRQASISKRFSDYIKPPKPSGDAAKDDWMVTGRANRRSIIAGVAEE